MVVDRRWNAVLARDPQASFFYSVKTTGVYCRPSCGARIPLRSNVEFHASAAAAEHAGFRPCKRCRPNESSAHATRVAALCQWIEDAETPPSLAELAAHAGWSPY